MITLSEFLPTRPHAPWARCRLIGVTHAIVKCAPGLTDLPALPPAPAHPGTPPPRRNPQPPDFPLTRYAHAWYACGPNLITFLIISRIP
jgi:hypothetical protein